MVWLSFYYNNIWSSNTFDYDKSEPSILVEVAEGGGESVNGAAVN